MTNTHEFAEAIEQARELTAQHGYSVTAWLSMLNRQAGNDPAKLRRAAAILAGLVESPITSSPRCRRSSGG